MILQNYKIFFLLLHIFKQDTNFVNFNYNFVYDKKTTFCLHKILQHYNIQKSGLLFLNTQLGKLHAVIISYLDTTFLNSSHINNKNEIFHILQFTTDKNSDLLNRELVTNSNKNQTIQNKKYLLQKTDRDSVLVIFKTLIYSSIDFMAIVQRVFTTFLILSDFWNVKLSFHKKIVSKMSHALIKTFFEHKNVENFYYLLKHRNQKYDNLRKDRIYDVDNENRNSFYDKIPKLGKNKNTNKPHIRKINENHSYQERNGFENKNITEYTENSINFLKHPTMPKSKLFFTRKKNDNVLHRKKRDLENLYELQKADGTSNPLMNEIAYNTESFQNVKNTHHSYIEKRKSHIQNHIKSIYHKNSQICKRNIQMYIRSIFISTKREINKHLINYEETTDIHLKESFFSFIRGLEDIFLKNIEKSILYDVNEIKNGGFMLSDDLRNKILKICMIPIENIFKELEENSSRILNYTSKLFQNNVSYFIDQTRNLDLSRENIYNDIKALSNFPNSIYIGYKDLVNSFVPNIVSPLSDLTNMAILDLNGIYYYTYLANQFDIRQAKKIALNYHTYLRIANQKYSKYKEIFLSNQITFLENLKKQFEKKIQELLFKDINNTNRSFLEDIDFLVKIF